MMRFEIVKKDNLGKDRVFYYTGELVSTDNYYVVLKTKLDGRLQFRREQLQSAKEIRNDEDDNYYQD